MRGDKRRTIRTQDDQVADHVDGRMADHVDGRTWRFKGVRARRLVSSAVALLAAAARAPVADHPRALYDGRESAARAGLHAAGHALELVAVPAIWIAER